MHRDGQPLCRYQINQNLKYQYIYFHIGITKESGGYTLRSELIFQNEDDHETWVKVRNLHLTLGR